jgi:hypothetical protein
VTLPSKSNFALRSQLEEIAQRFDAMTAQHGRFAFTRRRASSSAMEVWLMPSLCVTLQSSAGDTAPAKIAA